jgi:hypothetical protein
VGEEKEVCTDDRENAFGKREIKEEQGMKGKKKKDRNAERWEFYNNMADVGGDTIRDILQTLLVLSTLGVNIFVTDFTGTVLSEDDLEREDLPHLDMEAFIIPTGLRFLVPQPVDKEGRELFSEGTRVPSLLVVPRWKSGPLTDYPLLDHPYYIWTEVPDWLLERMGMVSPMIAGVERLDGEVEA